MATIEARITGVQKDEGTGWFRIGTDHDKVKRLDTKIEDKAKEALALKRSGEVAVIQYTPKPRYDEQTGRTYPNNYYEKALAKANGDSADSDDGIEVIRPTSRTTNPDDAWRMALSTGAKLAVATLPLMEKRDFNTQKTVALAWADFIVGTPRPNVRNPSSSERSVLDEIDSEFGDDGSEYRHTDADIPFGESASGVINEEFGY